MNKTIVAVAALLCVTVLIGVWIYSNSFRFVTANAGDGAVYRVDRTTGKTVLFYGDEEFPVVSPVPTPVESAIEKAIRMTKSARTLRGDQPNEEAVLSRFEELPIPLRIHGWSGREIEPGVVEVTFSFELAGKPRSYVFEAQTDYGLVRRMEK